MLPVGEGIGATHVECAVISPTRAAGRPPILTVADPLDIIPGPAGTHDGSMHGFVVSVTRAAGCPQILTVISPLRLSNGNPGWGTGAGTGAGGCIGAWQ